MALRIYWFKWYIALHVILDVYLSSVSLKILSLAPGVKRCNTPVRMRRKQGFVELLYSLASSLCFSYLNEYVCLNISMDFRQFSMKTASLRVFFIAEIALKE